MDYTQIILIALVITTFYILIQITQQTQESQPEKQQKEKIVYVSQPSYPSVPFWGQGPVWRGPIPGGRPWRRRRRMGRRRFWL